MQDGVAPLGEGDVTNVLPAMRSIATRKTDGAVLLMPTKLHSREILMTGCLHHAMVIKVFFSNIIDDVK